MSSEQATNRRICFSFLRVLLVIHKALDTQLVQGQIWIVKMLLINAVPCHRTLCFRSSANRSLCSCTKSMLKKLSRYTAFVFDPCAK